MIEWITGNSGVGKTELAKKLLDAKTIHLDGDDMRRVWTDLKFSDADRQVQNIRTAHLARVLEKQGFNVVVSTICPTDELKQKVKDICHCVFIHIDNPEDEKAW